MCTIRKTKNLLVIFGLLFFNVCYAQTSQWEVYNIIPNYKNISFIFNKNDVQTICKSDVWSSYRQNYEAYNVNLVIHDDYSVTFEYSTNIYLCQHRDDDKINEPYSITGKGVLLWKNDKMVLQLNVNEYSAGWYRYKDVKVNAPYYSYLLDMYIDRTEPGHEEYRIPRYEKQYVLCYDVIFVNNDNEQSFALKGNNISSTINCSYKRINDKTSTTLENSNMAYSTYINLTSRPFTFSANQKSESELNAENSDIYGKWQWNDDRSVIFLNSMTGEGSLLLWNNEDKLSWGFQMDNASSGYKTETTETGDELNYMMISFDGASEQSFAFDTKSDGTNRINFEYVQYDRFSGKLKRNASILGQIKDKRIMVVNYKQNGLDKTAMFQLEGLEAIFNALTEEDE